MRNWRVLQGPEMQFTETMGLEMETLRRLLPSSGSTERIVQYAERALQRSERASERDRDSEGMVSGALMGVKGLPSPATETSFLSIRVRNCPCSASAHGSCASVAPRPRLALGTELLTTGFVGGSSRGSFSGTPLRKAEESIHRFRSSPQPGSRRGVLTMVCEAVNQLETKGPFCEWFCVLRKCMCRTVFHMDKIRWSDIHEM
jgi:hypothetical protein